MASVQTSSYDGRYLKLTVTQTKGTSEQNYSTINWTLESIGGIDKYYTIFNQKSQYFHRAWDLELYKLNIR